ncbi:MAG: glycosyltransferase [Verrucomicrobia bacterium]|nr:glycosyltransferase [Verrucomicrobiota bacterium]
MSVTPAGASAEQFRGSLVKVLFFQHAANEFMSQLAQELGAAGITAALVFFSGTPDLGHDVKPTAQSHFLPMKSRLNPAAVLRLRRLIDRFRPNIIYCSTALVCFNSIIAQLPRKSSKLVFYRGAIRRPNWISPSDLLIFRSGWVDVFHCACSAVADSLCKTGVTRDKLSVFPPIGYSLSQFATKPLPPNLEKRSARHRIGAVANYRKIKGLEYLVDAMGLLTSRGLDVELVIVGEDKSHTLTRYVSKSPAASRILLAGPVVPAWPLMKTFDCLAVPSISEGLNKTVIEAFACDVPVVATNVGGIPDAVIHGMNGLLVQPGNPVQLAHAIEKVLTDMQLAAKFKVEGKRTFLEKYEASVVSSKYVELFRLMTT